MDIVISATRIVRQLIWSHPNDLTIGIVPVESLVWEITSQLVINIMQPCGAAEPWTWI
jgi:hypothetical protein